MAAKFTLVFVALLVLSQVIDWSTASARIEREVAAQDASKTIDDALKSFQAGVTNLVAGIQDNPLYKNFTTAVENFGKVLSQQGEQLVNKIKETTSN